MLWPAKSAICQYNGFRFVHFHNISWQDTAANAEPALRLADGKPGTNQPSKERRQGKGTGRQPRGGGRQSGSTRRNGSQSVETAPEEGKRQRGSAAIPGRLTAPVLVLNLNYVPVNVCTVRRAIVLVAKGKAELLELRSGESMVRTFNASLDAPSIIRLVYLVKRPFAPAGYRRRKSSCATTIRANTAGSVPST